MCFNTRCETYPFCPSPPVIHSSLLSKIALPLMRMIQIPRVSATLIPLLKFNLTGMLKIVTRVSARFNCVRPNSEMDAMISPMLCATLDIMAMYLMETMLP